MILLILLSVLLFILFGMAIFLCKRGQFYTDAFVLTPLGIYVWGDALVLAPFWAVVALIFAWLPPMHLLRFYLLFWAFRSAYEVIYWIGHQWAESKYVPPLLRNIHWLKPNDAAILYQVWSMCLALAATFAFISTYAH